MCWITVPLKIYSCPDFWRLWCDLLLDSVFADAMKAKVRFSCRLERSDKRAFRNKVEGDLRQKRSHVSTDKAGASEGPSPQRLEGAGRDPYLPQGIKEWAMPLLYSVFGQLASGSVGGSILLLWRGYPDFDNLPWESNSPPFEWCFHSKAGLVPSVSSLLRLREWHSRYSLLSVLGLHRDRHCLLHFYWYLRTA